MLLKILFMLLAAAVISLAPARPGWAQEEQETSTESAVATIKSSLGLNDTQVLQITPIVKKYLADLQKLRAQGSDQTVLQRSIGYLREDLDEQLINYLNPDQQERLVKARAAAAKQKKAVTPAAEKKETDRLPRMESDPKTPAPNADGVLQSGQAKHATSTSGIW